VQTSQKSRLYYYNYAGFIIKHAPVDVSALRCEALSRKNKKIIFGKGLSNNYFTVKVLEIFKNLYIHLKIVVVILAGLKSLRSRDVN